MDNIKEVIDKIKDSDFQKHFQFLGLLYGKQLWINTEDKEIAKMASEYLGYLEDLKKAEEIKSYAT